MGLLNVNVMSISKVVDTLTVLHTYCNTVRYLCLCVIFTKFSMKVLRNCSPRENVHFLLIRLQSYGRYSVLAPYRHSV